MSNKLFCLLGVLLSFAPSLAMGGDDHNKKTQTQNGCAPMTDLPSYVYLDDPQDKRASVLRNPAEVVAFPLSKEDEEIIRILSDKYAQEDNCAGLAAPQIGFSKQIIIFEVPDDASLKKWRPDLTQTMAKTIWINPTYEPVEQEKHTDYEACFSVKEVAGPVARFKTIRYSAYTPDGQQVTGIAEGFLARLIQHEVDHLRGRCFVDHVEPSKLMLIEEYRKKRKQEMGS